MSNTIQPLDIHSTFNNDSLMEGFSVMIDKPEGWTSFNVVEKIKKNLKIKKVGHAGTLDPNATGLLIICIGNATKKINSFTSLNKEYTGTLQLGVRTPSHDLETDFSEQHSYSNVSYDNLLSIVKSFMGKQKQMPPMFSAVKKNGKPLYIYARKGKSIDRIEREIFIEDFEIKSFRPPFVDFRLVCSKGTYIRVVVDDLGKKLGCGAVLTSLRRTRIGDYSVDNAFTIEKVMERMQSIALELT